MAKSTYYVTPRPDGDWNVKREGASRATTITSTQREAERRAKAIVSKSPDGGEVRIQGMDHKFRDSDTIGRKDPNPPKDRKF